MDDGLTASERAEKVHRMKLKAEREALQVRSQQQRMPQHAQGQDRSQDARIERREGVLVFRPSASSAPSLPDKGHTTNQSLGRGANRGAPLVENQARSPQVRPSTQDRVRAGSKMQFRRQADRESSSKPPATPRSQMISKPSFMFPASKSAVEKDSASSDGWGAGPTSTTSLEYGEKSQQLSTRAPTETLSMFGQAAQNSTSQSRTSSYSASDSQDRGLDSQDHVSKWQHLRRREPDAATTAPSARKAVSSKTQSQPQHKDAAANSLDSEWVDRKFQEHIQVREPSNQRATFTPAFLQQNPPVTSNASTKCARCGKMGHTARECSEPFTISRNNNALQRNSEFMSAETTVPQQPQNETKFRYIDAPVSGAESSKNVLPLQQDQTASDIPTLGSQTNVEHEENERRTSRRAIWADPDDKEAGRGFDRPPARTSKRWAARGEDEDGGRQDRSKKREGRRASREEDDDDEGGFRREEYKTRKLTRKREREEKKLREQREARQRREARKAENATPIVLPAYISVQQLSQALGARYETFVEELEELGYEDIFPGKIFNSELSTMIAMEYGFDPQFDDSKEAEERDLKAAPHISDRESLPARPPVVTIMGHVDHGKTTLLDYLRNASVAAGEAGGITQHIGAFSVPLNDSDRTITFLDTPGHAAFLAMRQRGANVTDIVILVVAADDSVKPQTIEAIKHAKGANVPIIVALTKVDKPEADVQRCKNDLARHGIDIEDFGGDTQVVCVSGKTGEGMDALEENITTLSEMLDHRAAQSGVVEGWVIEATTKASGRVATVLVRRGTLKPGCLLVAGKTWTRVRTLTNEAGQEVDEVLPGMPIEVDGWREQPVAGDEVLEAPSEQKATSVIDYRIEVEERERMAVDTEAINHTRKLGLEKREQERRERIEARALGDAAPATPAGPKPTTTFAATEAESGGPIRVPFIIKADVSGSAEAVAAYIQSIDSPLIAPRILHAEVGAVHESDIDLAVAANAHIVAFNLPADANARSRATAHGSTLR